jgi:TonB family protein
VEILRLVANDLRSFGIRVRERALDAVSFITAIMEGDFDGFIMGWSVGEKIDPAVYWHSDSLKGKYNFVSYKNSTVDSLIDLGVAMLNRKKAEQIWGEFQKIIYADQPYTFLIVPNAISAFYKRVRGTEQGIALASSYTYWIPEAERRVVVAAVTPPPEVKEEVIEEEPTTTPTPTEKPPEKRVEEKVEKKPPAVVAPEKLLEAAAKKETTAVATAPPVTPPPPPKPSVITRATPTKQVMPRYPEAARTIGAAGRVVVRALVGKDGKVKEVTILKSFGNPACEEAALSAAKKWEFKPATKDGVPFEQRISIPFDFRP